jgi:Putative zinc- or iron-chelating domain
MTRSETDAALATLYERIPAIPDCDGRCWTSCGPVDMSWRERSRIREAGVRITPWQEARARLDTFWCEALTGDKRCAVYELRPLVCRLWGAAEGLECPYGCIPEGGLVSREDAYRLIAESMRIGGHENALAGAALDKALARRDVQEEMDRILDQGRAGEALRAGYVVPAAFRKQPGGA